MVRYRVRKGRRVMGIVELASLLRSDPGHCKGRLCDGVESKLTRKHSSGSITMITGI